MMTSSNRNIFWVTGPLCGEFTAHKGQWREALMFSLICVWINGWVNNGEAGDLRRHHGHYDVNVMWPLLWYQMAAQKLVNIGSGAWSLLSKLILKLQIQSQIHIYCWPMSKIPIILGMYTACSFHSLVMYICITWWCHQMETFSALLAICAGNSPVTGEFSLQRPVM